MGSWMVLLSLTPPLSVLRSLPRPYHHHHGQHATINNNIPRHDTACRSHERLGNAAEANADAALGRLLDGLDQWHAIARDEAQADTTSTTPGDAVDISATRRGRAAHARLGRLASGGGD